MTISSLISAVPDVIWSAVVASVLTLSGVLIANRSTTARFRLQLKYDAEEKARERKAILRREVYLQAAEESVKASNRLGSLPQADLSKTNLADECQGFFIAAAKVQLVSEPKTASVAGELATMYGELILKVLAKIMPLQSLRSDIAIRDAHYNRTQSEISRILAAMTQFNESKQSDANVFQALNRSFEFHQGQAVTFATERAALWEQHNSLHFAFVRYLLIEMKQLGQHQVQVMVEIRRELELDTNAAHFSHQMEMQWKRLSEQVDTFLEALAKNA